jgi:hypothetical protein
MRAVHPGFTLLIEKLDRHEQPAARPTYEADELRTVGVAARSLTDVVGRGEHLRNMREAKR